jgi:phosphate transport system protein
MSEKFHAELKDLKKDTAEMVQFSRDMLSESVHALILQDPVMAKQVSSKKKHIKDITITLEDRTYALIALYQPMAKDMRVITCILKMISAAERIGRYGKDIANMVKHIQDQHEFTQPVPLQHMAEQVLKMIDDVIIAFETEHLEVIKDFSSRDDAVDSLWHSIFREMLTFMMENPKTITRGTYSIMVARYLERSGDHACKMAENVHYMITGERIEIK